jgi:hypothetical protein
MVPSPGDAMSDLERVARAIARAVRARYETQSASPLPWIEEDWEPYLPLARAALTELRDPSDAMLAAVPIRLGPAKTWRAMIDAILSAPQP